ncbi:MAG TPA: SulP family inorganic anion transporter [Candidatus Dormibacteraeota bacterium]|nr:SulP family inorganic anion transporter [Candidatus Dormibacteraeota bacterium]
MGLLASLRGYRRAWLSADMAAALTLLVIALPEQLATSRLAAMPPVTGFYAFVAGTVLFALLGSNPRMSVGADSTIAPVFAVGVAGLAASGSAGYVGLVGILAVMVGIIVLAVGLLRLGWIAELLSAPIIAGFLGGVAVIIAVHELPDLLGVAEASGTTVDRIGSVARHLGELNGWSLGIGLAVLAAVLAGERIDRRFPGALIGVVASTALVAGAGLAAHGVHTLGDFPHGAPNLGLHGLSWSAVRDLLPIAGAVALLIVIQSAATTRAFGGGDPRAVNVSRDFTGVGAGSVLAGLVGAFPVNASPPRTAAVAAAGGRTQAAGLGAAAALVLLIPAAGLLADLPLATLAAVLLYVAGRTFPARRLLAIARFDAVEASLAAVTLLTVALVGVGQGIGVAVGLAILDRTRLSASPQLHVLGRMPGTTSWAPRSGLHDAEQIPGVLVVLFATPLWYANATHFRVQVDTAIGNATPAPRLLVLDAIGMSDVDYTGSRALSDLLDELDRRGITLAVARAGRRVRAGLERGGVLQRIGADRFFATVDAAVTTMSRALGIAAT